MTGETGLSVGALIEAAGLEDARQALTELGPPGVEAAILPVLRRAGYRQAAVQAAESVEGETLRLRVVVTAGPLWHLGEVVVGGGLGGSDPDLAARLAGWRGRVYTEVLEAEVLAAVSDGFSAQGYQVDQVDLDRREEAGWVHLSLDVQTRGPDRLRHRLLIGDLATRDRVLRILLPSQQPGEPLDRNAIDRSEARLYASGLFENVAIRPQPAHGSPGEWDTVTFLREAPRYTFGYGFGYNEWEGPRGFVDWTDGNLFGHGQVFGVLLRGSAKKVRAQASLYDPQLLLPGWPLSLSVFAERQERTSFRTRRISLFARSSITLADRMQLLLQVGHEKVTNRFLVEGVDLGDLLRSEVPVTLTAASFALVRDTRNDLMDPTRGGMTTVDLSVAPKMLGARTGFVKFFVQEQRYLDLGADHVLALSVRLGWLGTYSGEREAPISERFFAGGAGSLRGFAQDRAGPVVPGTNLPLGGKALAIGNLEWRFPLIRPVYGAVFYDVGNVFADLRSSRWADVSHTVGGGLRLRTPLGPIRVDVGVSLKDVGASSQSRLLVTIGHAF